MQLRLETQAATRGYKKHMKMAGLSHFCGVSFNSYSTLASEVAQHGCKLCHWMASLAISN
jgi:hypothetical protein